MGASHCRAACHARRADTSGGRGGAARPSRSYADAATDQAWRVLARRMRADRVRRLELDGPPLDTNAIVLGDTSAEQAGKECLFGADLSAILWGGSVAS